MFVVPTVPLVYQQADTIRQFTGLEAKSFCGEMGVDFWDRNKWMDELDLPNTHVIVLTPQILFNILSHAYLDISVFHLLIIDECHHARKSNAVAVLFREFYHTIKQGQSRPKVLGLTASPIWTPDNPDKSLHELQMILASTIIAVKINMAELAQHAPRPKEHVAFYKADIVVQNTELWTALNDLKRDDWELPKLQWSKIKTRARVALTGLGPLGMDLYLLKQLQEPVREIINDAKLGYSLAPEIDRKLAQELYDMLDPLELDIGTSISLDSVSPKVQALVKVLSKYHAAATEESEFQVIIFVQQRHIAFGLAELLEKLDEVSSWIKVRTLVGHGSSDSVAVGQAFNEQKKLVRDFREQKFNVLICTR